jgi:hypothetical protein
VEESTGIAYVQQRVRYLEDYDLGDELRLYDCGVVPGASLQVHLWSDWAGVSVSMSVSMSVFVSVVSKRGSICASQLAHSLTRSPEIYDFVRESNSEGLMRRLAADMAAAAAAPASLRAHVGRSFSAPAASPPPPSLAPPESSSPTSPGHATTSAKRCPHSTATPARTQHLTAPSAAVATATRPSHTRRTGDAGPPLGLGEGAWAALYLAAFEGSVRLCRL